MEQNDRSDELLLSDWKLRRMCFSHQYTCVYEKSSPVHGSNAVLLGDIIDGSDASYLFLGLMDGKLHVFDGRKEKEPSLAASNLGTISALAKGNGCLYVCSIEGLLHVFRFENLLHNSSLYHSDGGARAIEPLLTLSAPINIVAAAAAERGRLILASSDGSIFLSHVPHVEAQAVSPRDGARTNPTATASAKSFDELQSIPHAPSADARQHLAPVHLIAEQCVGARVSSICFCPRSRFLLVGTDLGDVKCFVLDVGSNSIRRLRDDQLPSIPVSACSYRGPIALNYLQSERKEYVAYASVDSRVGLLEIAECESPAAEAEVRGGSLRLEKSETAVDPIGSSNKHSTNQRTIPSKSVDEVKYSVSCSNECRSCDAKASYVGEWASDVGDERPKEQLNLPRGGYVRESFACKLKWNIFTSEPLASISAVTTVAGLKLVTVCSWSGQTIFLNVSGQCFGVFDAGLQIEGCFQAFTCGSFSRTSNGSEPSLVYVSGVEVVVHHSLSHQVLGFGKNHLVHRRSLATSPFFRNGNGIELASTLDALLNDGKSEYAEELLAQVQRQLGRKSGRTAADTVLRAREELSECVACIDAHANFAAFPSLKIVLGTIHRVGFCSRLRDKRSNTVEIPSKSAT